MSIDILVTKIMELDRDIHSYETTDIKDIDAEIQEIIKQFNTKCDDFV